MANFCCPIEMEPRTLKQGQITHAREIAVDIVQNKEHDEATSIFIEGLKPVEAIKETAGLAVSDSILPHKVVAEESRDDIKTCCVCSGTAVSEESTPLPNQFKPKVPLSAPF